jgi:adenosine kinase
MVDYPRACKARGIHYILDPGQSLPMWDKNDLIEAIDGCRILIVNDYELSLIISKTGMDKNVLLEKAGMIITTLGETGSQISSRDFDISVPAYKVKKVVDPTGAGDSYRGGLLSGLVRGKTIEECAWMGSVCSSFSVESYGTQEYSFTSGEFNERLHSRK